MYRTVSKQLCQNQIGNSQKKSQNGISHKDFQINYCERQPACGMCETEEKSVRIPLAESHRLNSHNVSVQIQKHEWTVAMLAAALYTRRSFELRCDIEMPARTQLHIHLRSLISSIQFFFHFFYIIISLAVVVSARSSIRCSLSPHLSLWLVRINEIYMYRNCRSPSHLEKRTNVPHVCHMYVAHTLY